MTTTRPRHRRGSLGQTFLAPASLAAATLAGLISGLTGDGVRDVLSWALLALPLLAIALSWRRRNR